MTEKKTPHPRFGGLTLPGIIAILTGLVSLTVFLTGKSTLPDIIAGNPATATFTPAPTMTPPPYTETPDPSPTLRPTETVAPLPFIAEPPSDSDLEAYESIWSLTRYRELTAPGLETYTVAVKPDSIWLWEWTVCAKSSVYKDFLDVVSLQLLVDEIPLSAKQFRMYDSQGAAGWLCRNWAVKLSGWPKDSSVFLEVSTVQEQTANDGDSDFAMGQYRQLIIAVVEP